MSYTISYTDTSKPEIIVEDRLLNNETSLTFPGNFTTDYGKVISENFLHILENFASNESPANPSEGQLWYYTDNNDTRSNELRVYNGSQWVSSSGLVKSENQPSSATSVRGDLWVNLESQQLYLFTGTSWILVGPEFSSGIFTGIRVEDIVDTTNTSNTVFSVRISENIIAIYSNTDREFIPKTQINGFSSIKKGINLNNLGYKFYGVSEKAENLVVGTGTGQQVVSASNFLRSDQNSQTNYKLSVLNNEGIVIGANSQSSIRIDGTTTVIQNSVSGSNIEIKTKKDASSPISRAVEINSNGKVTIGLRNETEGTNTKLLVGGDVKIIPETELSSEISGILFVESTAQSSSIGNGSIVSRGGIGIAKNIFVGGDASIQGSLTTGNINPPLSGANADIGTPTFKFNNVYANTFQGNLRGAVIGNVAGNASTADKLRNAKTFSFSGDVQPTSFQFDGQNDVSVSLRLTTGVISNRLKTIDSLNTDEILINKQSGSSPGLYRISKSDFLKTVPVMPAGMISPYAGQVAPDGWLLCDGSQVRKADYLELFEVIGYSFNPLLIDDLFELPNLRGRFPYGAVSGNPLTQFGAKGGNSEVTLTVRNLPAHEHTLTGSSGSQFYAVRVGDENPIDDNAIGLSIGLDDGGTQGIPTSGPVQSSQSIGRPVNVLNPYLAINYIIYTGKRT